MRITFWAKRCLLCVVLVAVQAVAPLLSAGVPGLTLTSTVTASSTLLHLHGGYISSRAVVLRRDPTVARSITPPVLKLVGELPGKAVLLTDTYRSAPLGLSFCQAGEEQFLRVIRTAGPKPRETSHLKIASCRDNIELAEPGLQWSAQTSTLTIHWLQPPAGQPALLILSVDTSGHVQTAEGAGRP